MHSQNHPQRFHNQNSQENHFPPTFLPPPPRFSPANGLLNDEQKSCDWYFCKYLTRSPSLEKIRRDSISEMTGEAATMAGSRTKSRRRCSQP
mmetsp:Transcript_5370/g.11669  ORF Transcript_5370/g.11669 Transcript_5370/m.11669 type:complete len:92 (+) Transcript_5370:3-278(+)